MKGFFPILILAFSAFFSVSCAGDDESLKPHSVEEIEVQYRVIVSEEYQATAAFASASYSVISQDQIKGTWTSGVFKVDKAQVTISAGASPDKDHSGTANEGELIAQILIGGKVAKEAKATGKTISLTLLLSN